MTASDSNPILDLALVERALSLVYQVPIYPPKSASIEPFKATRALDREKNRKARKQEMDPLGPQAVDLANLLQAEWHIFQRLLGLAFKEEALTSKPSTRRFLLRVAAWIGEPSQHFTSRLELIEVLTEMRRAALARLWVPIAPTPDQIAEAADRAGMWNAVPKWSDLTASQRGILLAVGKEPLTAKEIAKRLNRKFVNLQRPLADLTKRRVLSNTPGSGYSICHLPSELPAEVEGRLRVTGPQNVR